MMANIIQEITERIMKTPKVTQDILVLQFNIVNVCLIGDPASKTDEWVLIDAGLSDFAPIIQKAAQERFGPDSRPKAIILTHGHFDHVGSLTELADRWGVSIYAHEFEMPFLTGKRDYPPPDPSVDPGLIAKLSPMMPRWAINLGHRVKTLPVDGTIPGMPEWRWIHTPGHTPGHISLFRDRDRVLIVGDAFTTVKQESAGSVIKQNKDVNGPPAYFTPDWKQAEESVKLLAELKPSLVVPSHGLPLSGKELTKHLEKLARDFEAIALPEHGRYVK